MAEMCEKPAAISMFHSQLQCNLHIIKFYYINKNINCEYLQYPEMVKMVKILKSSF